MTRRELNWPADPVLFRWSSGEILGSTEWSPSVCEPRFHCGLWGPLSAGRTVDRPLTATPRRPPATFWAPPQPGPPPYPRTAAEVPPQPAAPPPAGTHRTPKPERALPARQEGLGSPCAARRLRGSGGPFPQPHHRSLHSSRSTPTTGAPGSTAMGTSAPARSLGDRSPSPGNIAMRLSAPAPAASTQGPQPRSGTAEGLGSPYRPQPPLLAGTRSYTQAARSPPRRRGGGPHVLAGA